MKISNKLHEVTCSLVLVERERIGVLFNSSWTLLAAWRLKEIIGLREIISSFRRSDGILTPVLAVRDAVFFIIRLKISYTIEFYFRLEFYSLSLPILYLVAIIFF